MRKFILGAGAQKAGTTWLYEQFARQDNFKAPHTKEMHIFDAIYLRDDFPFGRDLEARMAKLLQNSPDTFTRDFLTKRFQMYLDPAVYFKYFDDLLTGETSFSCDVTPTYSALPVEALDMIKTQFEARDIQTSVVFLMREPVSRVESAIKMHLRINGRLGTTSVDEMMKRMEKSSASPRERLRSSYRASVNRLTDVFGEDQVFLGFYETLFTAPEQERIAQFFDLDLNKFDATTKVNHTSTSFSYPEEFLQGLKANYEDEYDFAINEMGLDASIWENRLDKLSR